MSTSTRAVRAPRLLVMASILVLALSASATASTGQQKIKLTSEGQAAAKAALLTLDDFSYIPGWTGGPVKPDAPSSAECVKPGSKPLTLVTNGDQKTTFKYPGLSFTSEATVFETAAMVRRDWARSFWPQMLPCLRKTLAKSIRPNTRIVSVKTLSFPRVASTTYAIRVKMIVTVNGKSITMLADSIFLGSGRTEAVMSIASPPTPHLVAVEAHFAQLIATRITL
jgi:hypothetical protein